METTFYLISINFFECTKFRGLRSIVGLVPSCLRGYFVSEIFSRGYFSRVQKCFPFLLGISWVQKFSRGYFEGPKTFSGGYFVSPKLFFVGILSVQFFFLVANFVIQRFSIVSWARKSDTKQKYINTSQTAYSSANRFQQLSVVYIRKVLHLLDYLCYYSAFIRSNCVFSHLFSTVLDLFT